MASKVKLKLISFGHTTSRHAMPNEIKLSIYLGFELNGRIEKVLLCESNDNQRKLNAFGWLDSQTIDVRYLRLWIWHLYTNWKLTPLPLKHLTLNKFEIVEDLCLCRICSQHINSHHWRWNANDMDKWCSVKQPAVGAKPAAKQINIKRNTFSWRRASSFSFAFTREIHITNTRTPRREMSRERCGGRRNKRTNFLNRKQTMPRKKCTISHSFCMRIAHARNKK